MSQLPPCPQCASEFTYEDGTQLVCPECGYEWSEAEAAAAAKAEAKAKADAKAKKKEEKAAKKAEEAKEAKSAKTKGAKKEKEESKKTSKTVDDVPGHNYKTMPKKPSGPYILYVTEETKRLKEEDGLDHAVAFS